MLGGGRAAAGGTRLHRRRLLYSVGRLDGHAGGNAVRGDARGDAVLLALHLRHDRLRGEHDAGDAAGVGEAGAGDLGGVQDAALQQVLHLAVHRVVPVLPRQPLQLLHHHLAVHAAVERNQLERRRDRLHHDVRTKALLLVGQRRFELGHHLRQVEEGRATSGDNALLHSREGRVLGVLDAQLAVLQLRLRRGTHLDDGDAAGELRDALAELFDVVRAVAVFELLLDLSHPHRDLLLAARLRDDGGAGGRDGDLTRGAQLLKYRLLKLHPQVASNVLRPSHNRNILEQRLPALTKARRLDGADLNDTAHLVHHKRRQRLAHNVFRHNH
mmetsp:Transcript_5439/g.9770  ORF Transcript_5439/g.9770 Transcript_5439/m.9770 type:complete len:328 (-) Transcript_5439:1106-2089(-)